MADQVQIENSANDDGEQYALRFVDGNRAGATWPLSDTPIQIGRDIANHIRIVDPFVSRRHCEVVVDKGLPFIRSLSEQNPTLVNQQPRVEGFLAVGDLINFASASLQVVMQETREARGDVHTEPRTTLPFSRVLHLSETCDEAAYAGRPGRVSELHQLFLCVRDLGRASTLDSFVETLRSRVERVFSPDASWVLLPIVPGEAPLHSLELGGPCPDELGTFVAQAVGSANGLLGALRFRETLSMAIAAPITRDAATFGVVACVRSATRGGYDEGDLHALMALTDCSAPLALLLLQREQMQRDLELGARGAWSSTRLVGDSRLMQELRARIVQAARVPGNVLVFGETGVGKELVARAIHDASPRREGPYVAVNCAAIAPELFASEFFGHEAGAFTGAVRSRRGYFQEADSGTLFLDEIGDLEPNNQAALLRAVETGEFRPVGAARDSRADVRIISATNRLLAPPRSSFRADLYHRVSSIVINLPPLHERPEDLPALAEYFLARVTLNTPAKPVGFTPAALRRLQAYPWPGNVRELRNVVECAAYSAGGLLIDACHLHLETSTDQPPAVAQDSEVPAHRAALQALLDQHGGDVELAAESIGIARSTLYYRMRKLGIATPRRQHG